MKTDNGKKYAIATISKRKILEILEEVEYIEDFFEGIDSFEQVKEEVDALTREDMKELARSLGEDYENRLEDILLENFEASVLKSRTRKLGVWLLLSV